MCHACYVRYGSPSIDSVRTRHAAELIRRVYEQGAVGGNAHIVLDDWNLEDAHIRWCLDEALVENIHCTDVEVERRCLEAMLELSMDERASAMALAYV